MTPFVDIYNIFLNKLTDDMYCEFTELDTYRMLEPLLKSAIQCFEFPRVNLYDYETNYAYEDTYYCGVESDFFEVPCVLHTGGYFNENLSEEEKTILAHYMVIEWIGQQLASIENTRMKYSGSDFKFTSQANHIQKLNALKRDYEKRGLWLQRLYNRRMPDKETGVYKNTIPDIMSSSPIGRAYVDYNRFGGYGYGRFR